MGNSSGSFARTALTWLIVAVVAIFAFKIVFGIIAGVFQFMLAVAFLFLIGWAVLWALRRL
jgi:hypothetical protein